MDFCRIRVYFVSFIPLLLLKIHNNLYVYRTRNIVVLSRDEQKVFEL